MNESILISIKKMLGITEMDFDFDTDITIHINTVFSILQQLGVGPKEGFFITDDSTVWSDYIQDAVNLNLIVSYVYTKVKLIFDPPSSSQLATTLNENVKEMEWRINSIVDYPVEETT